MIESSANAETDDEDTGDQRSVAEAGGDDDTIERSFTFRALISGLFIGILVNLSNTYYGLRIGAGSSMAMVSGLIGYVGFKTFSRYTVKRFTPAENVLIVSTATATGCMPLTAGFIGIIPALEYLIGPDENGPVRVKFASLILWSIGLCFFGIIFASSLRESFIERERLPWPGAKATAHLINTLHDRHQKVPTAAHSILPSVPDSDREEYHDSPREAAEHWLGNGSKIEWRAAMNSLLRGTVASGFIV